MDIRPSYTPSNKISNDMSTSKDTDKVDEKKPGIAKEQDWKIIDKLDKDEQYNFAGVILRKGVDLIHGGRKLTYCISLNERVEPGDVVKIWFEGEYTYREAIVVRSTTLRKIFEDPSRIRIIRGVYKEGATSCNQETERMFKNHYMKPGSPTMHAKSSATISSKLVKASPRKRNIVFATVWFVIIGLILILIGGFGIGILILLILFLFIPALSKKH